MSTRASRSCSVLLVALVACDRAEPVHETETQNAGEATEAEADKAPADPNEALLLAAHTIADAAPIFTPAPEYVLRVELEQLGPRRRQENPTPSPDWVEPAPSWEPALQLPGPQLPRDMPWYLEDTPGACEIEYHRWPPKSGPHADGIYTRVFVVELAHGQPSVLWVDHFDDREIDVEVRARWLTPSRLASIEKRPRRLRRGDVVGSRWEYGVSGELLGGWTVMQGWDDRLHEHNDFLIDHDERLRPVQIRHFDDSGELLELSRVIWDERPLRRDDYRSTAAEPDVYILYYSVINSWQAGWLRSDTWLRMSMPDYATSIHAETVTGWRSILHVHHGRQYTRITQTHDGGRTFVEHNIPATGYERRQTYSESLPLTREAREVPGDWHVDERWDRSADRVEHWRGGELVTVAFLDCTGRPRPEALGF